MTMTTASAPNKGAVKIVAAKFTKAADVNLRKLRYVDDYNRLLKEMETEIDDNAQLIKQQQKMLAVNLLGAGMSKIKAAFEFDVTPTDRKSQLKMVKRLKQTIDPKLSKVIVPNLDKLKSQYSLAEDLYEKHKTLEAMETQLGMSFPDRRGEAYSAAVSSIKALKDKVAGQLKQVLGFLNEVAAKHVPDAFVDYIDEVRDLVSESVTFKDSDTYMYVSVTDKGDLVFTYYIMLIDAINEEGEIAPHLYISIQWKLGAEASVRVQLNHEYEVPNKLLKSGGTDVESVGDAVRAIAHLLNLESFSTDLGVVPLALQLKITPEALKPELFGYRDLIESIKLDDNTLSFTVRPEANSEELVWKIAHSLYPEVRQLLKQGRDSGIKMALTQGKKPVIKFNISKLAKVGDFSSYDAEMLRDRFGLNDTQIRKIMTMISQSAD